MTFYVFWVVAHVFSNTLGWGSEPPILGKTGRGSRKGLWMVPSERALVSSYNRPSVVTLLYLYAFQRYCRFCAPARHFSPPHLPCSPGISWMAFEKSEVAGLIVRSVSFQDFQPMWSWSTNVTDGRTQTDGRHAISNTALCTSASRGKNRKCCVSYLSSLPTWFVIKVKTRILFYRFLIRNCSEYWICAYFFVNTNFKKVRVRYS